MNSRLSGFQGRAGGFSLIELLAVIAVMATITALTVQGIGSALNGMKITSATQTLVDEIQVARATSLARNAPVEVWFLKIDGRFKSVRSLIVNADSKTTWISRARLLPEGIVIAANAIFSNVIGSQTIGTPPDSRPGTEGVRLRIFPSGKLELVDALAIGPNQQLFLTIASAAGFDPDTGSTLPRNFATVEINPLNSRITTHRP